jgi:hypothetical protein
VSSTDRRKDDRWVVLPITSYPAQVISMKNIVSIFKETTGPYSENNRKRNSVCAWDKLGSVSLLAVVLMLPYQDAFGTASYFSMEQCTKSGLAWISQTFGKIQPNYLQDVLTTVVHLLL